MITPSLSVVIPIFNEAESIPELHTELKDALARLGLPFEVIVVDDGSSDQSLTHLKAAHAKDPRFKWIRLRSHFGKSAALAAGFEAASGEVVMTMDGDLQDNPAEIGQFLNKIEEGCDVVSGWKLKRKDSWFRIFLSKVFNVVTSWISGIKLHDFNCGFKAYRRAVLKEIHIYGELHRYIPLLVAQRGFRIAEIRVDHRKRKYGRSKYGSERILSGFLDLVTVLFLTRFTKKPAHFFGTIGFALTATGLLINGYIAFLRFQYGNIQSRYPLLFLGVLLTIVGIQFVSTGLLAEMITFGQKKLDSEYSVAEQSG